MKKTLALMLCAVLLISAFTVCTSAYTEFAAKRGVSFEVQKATAEFKADGVISEGEFYELPVTNDMFEICHPGDADEDLINAAKAMGASSKWYASWDDDSLNIAIVCTPNEILQTLYSTWASGDGDTFCNNTGLNIQIYSQKTVGTTVNEDGEEVECRGHWCGGIARSTDAEEVATIGNDGMFCGAWGGQNGYTGSISGGDANFLMEAKKDFYIAYPGDGTVIYEFAMPFKYMNGTEKGEIGQKYYMSLALCSGSDEYAVSWSAAYVCGLGEFVYFGLNEGPGTRSHTEYVLAAAPAGDTPDTPDTPDEPVNPPTMDITLVLLAVASVSAVVVAKKRK